MKREIIEMNTAKYLRKAHKELTAANYFLKREKKHVVYEHVANPFYKVVVAKSPNEWTHAMKLMRKDIRKNQRLMNAVPLAA